MDYTADKLLIRARTSGQVLTRFSAEQAGWRYLNMVVMALQPGQSFSILIEEYEYLAVVLGGVCSIKTSRGEYPEVGRRPDVFTGLPYAIYMPRQTEFEIEAMSEDFSVAMFWVPTDEDHPIQLIRPQDVTVAYMGGGNASYQVTHILPPGFAAQRLIAREIYIPGGNWANFPPYKHDTAGRGKAGETAFESAYLYKYDRPYGFAMQRLYTAEGDLDVSLAPTHNDTVLVPKGYHPIVGAHGHITYALNVLAGASNQYRPTYDPRYRWVDQTWMAKDPRLPIVDLGMEPLEDDRA